MRRLLFAGQALDAATFALFFLVVPASILAELEKAERNPIVATLFAMGGFALVAIVKVGAASLVVWRDQRRPDRPRVTGTVMAIAAGSGFLGAGFNLLALWTVVGALSA